MKRLILGLALAVGLFAACSPGATPSVRVVTPAPSLPAASMPASSIGAGSSTGAGASFGAGSSGLFASPSKTP